MQQQNNTRFVNRQETEVVTGEELIIKALEEVVVQVYDVGSLKYSRMTIEEIMTIFWAKIKDQIIKNFKIKNKSKNNQVNLAISYDVVFDHICGILSTKTQLEVDNLLDKYPQELINELLNMPDSDLKGQMVLLYLQVNDLEINESVDMEQMLKFYLDLLFHVSDNYNCNPYLLVHSYSNNHCQIHAMTHMLAEKICDSITNLRRWQPDTSSFLIKNEQPSSEISAEQQNQSSYNMSVEIDNSNNLTSATLPMTSLEIIQ